MRRSKERASSTCETRRVKHALGWRIRGDAWRRFRGDPDAREQHRRERARSRRRDDVGPRAGRADDRAVGAALIRAAGLILVGALLRAVILAELDEDRRRAADHEDQHERDHLKKPGHRRRL